MKCLRSSFFLSFLLVLAAGLTGCSRPATNTWLTSVPDAMTQAKNESKLVLLNFTGSDWCEYCKKLDDDIFSKSAFADYAKKNLVLVMLDFPAQKKLDPALEKANDALKDKYKIQGYPTLILLKSDGTPVWTNLGYLEGGPAAMIAQLDQAKKK